MATASVLISATRQRAADVTPDQPVDSRSVAAAGWTEARKPTIRTSTRGDTCVETETPFRATGAVNSEGGENGRRTPGRTSRTAATDPSPRGPPMLRQCTAILAVLLGITNAAAS